MIYQLTYRSSARKDISPSDLEAIVESSGKNNGKKGITGCLIYHNGHFVQILEGSQNEVRQLCQVISEDPRHSMLEILSEGAVSERIFESWDMGFYNISDQLTDKKEAAIASSILELKKNSVEERFTTKVFWYNVRTLFQEKGFYRNQ